MSTTSVSSLSAGSQQLYDQGLLPSGISNSTLNGASASQLSQLVGASVALQQVNTLLGISASTDTASLSSTATDSLTQAVNNELTASLDAAVKQFLPQSSTAPGSQINLLA